MATTNNHNADSTMPPEEGNPGTLDFVQELAAYEIERREECKDMLQEYCHKNKNIITRDFYNIGVHVITGPVVNKMTRLPEVHSTELQKWVRSTLKTRLIATDNNYQLWKLKDGNDTQ